MSESNGKSGGIGVLGLLGVLFVGLKLTGYIGWGWWLVLLPFYVPIVLYIVVVLVIFYGPVGRGRKR